MVAWSRLLGAEVIIKLYLIQIVEIVFRSFDYSGWGSERAKAVKIVLFLAIEWVDESAVDNIGKT